MFKNLMSDGKKEVSDSGNLKFKLLYLHFHEITFRIMSACTWDLMSRDDNEL